MTASPRSVNDLPEAMRAALWECWTGSLEHQPGIWPSEAHRQLWLDGYITMYGGTTILLTAAGLRLLGMTPRPRAV